MTDAAGTLRRFAEALSPRGRYQFQTYWEPAEDSLRLRCIRDVKGLTGVGLYYVSGPALRLQLPTSVYVDIVQSVMGAADRALIERDVLPICLGTD